jgi:3-oxoacyl-(acyl-carrier-protein) synthase
VESSRVVISAAAAYTCCGLGCEAFWSYFSRQWLDEHNSSRRLPPVENFTCKKIRTTHPLAVRILTAIEHDLGRFFEELGAEDREQTGVALGSAYAHLSSYFDYYEKATRGGYQVVNPRHFPFTLPNFCASEVSATYSLWGSSTSIFSGLSSGLEAIGYAASAIRRGEERTVLAGGFDEFTEYNQEVFERTGLRSLSGRALPFAPERDGTLPGEGVALLLVESAEVARNGGRRALAEIGGFASGNSIHWDSYGASDKAKKIVLEALSQGDCEPATIDAVFPSANGSIRGDEFEQDLLQRIFRSHLSSVLICPIKRVTGECFAASGPLQALAAIRCCMLGTNTYAKIQCLSRSGTTLNVVQQLQPVSNALVYSAGYDGTFAAMVFRRPEL